MFVMGNRRAVSVLASFLLLPALFGREIGVGVSSTLGLEASTGFRERRRGDLLQWMIGKEDSVYRDSVYQQNSEIFRKDPQGRQPTPKTSSGFFPDCVALGRNGNLVGSGVILDGGIILTACHLSAIPNQAWMGAVCPFKTDNVRVPASDKQTGTLLSLTHAISHPDYMGRTMDPIGNDLMLLRVAPESRAKIKVHAELADEATTGGVIAGETISVRVVGFGISGYTVRGGEYAGIKRELSVIMARRNWPGLWMDPPGRRMEFAAAPLDPMFDPCNGDSGGPAYVVKNGLFHLVGIVSRGIKPAKCGLGTVYTIAPLYRNWIVEARRNQNEGWKRIQ